MASPLVHSVVAIDTNVREIIHSDSSSIPVGNKTYGASTVSHSNQNSASLRYAMFSSSAEYAHNYHHVRYFCIVMPKARRLNVSESHLFHFVLVCCVASTARNVYCALAWKLNLLFHWFSLSLTWIKSSRVFIARRSFCIVCVFHEMRRARYPPKHTNVRATTMCCGSTHSLTHI